MLECSTLLAISTRDLSVGNADAIVAVSGFAGFGQSWIESQQQQ